jgi:Recombinase zinc beta ribbon domain
MSSRTVAAVVASIVLGGFDLATACTRRERSGCVSGMARRGTQDRESRHLLTNFARCAQCGGSIGAHSRSHGEQRVYFYGCLTFWKKGGSKCSNNLAARMDVLDAEVLATVCDDILRPAVVEQAIALALDELTPSGRKRNSEGLDAEIRGLESECQRLADAIARGGRLDVLLRTLEDRQERLRGLQAHRAAVPEPMRPAFDRTGMERRLGGLVEDWRSLLTRDIASGREVLRALLVGPLRFTPVVDGRRRGYAFEGGLALDRLVSGVIDLPTFVASPTGFEPVF